MSTTVRNHKIPQNPRVRKGTDTVVPSVKGNRTLIPSTLGAADRARFGRYAAISVKVAEAIVTISQARALSAEHPNDPNVKGLAEVAAEPVMMSLLRQVLAATEKGVNLIVEDITRAHAEKAKDGTEATNSGPFNMEHGDPLVQAGMDRAVPVMDAYFVDGNSLSAEDRHAAAIQMEQAHKRAQQVRDSLRLGTAANPARVAAGLPDDEAVGDAVYAGLGRKGHQPGRYYGKE